MVYERTLDVITKKNQKFTYICGVKHSSLGLTIKKTAFKALTCCSDSQWHEEIL